MAKLLTPEEIKENYPIDVEESKKLNYWDSAPNWCDEPIYELVNSHLELSQRFAEQGKILKDLHEEDRLLRICATCEGENQWDGHCMIREDQRDIRPEMSCDEWRIKSLLSERKEDRENGKRSEKKDADAEREGAND